MVLKDKFFLLYFQSHSQFESKAINPASESEAECPAEPCSDSCTESQDDLESVSSMTMIYRYPETGRKSPSNNNKNSFENAAPAHDSRLIASEPGVTEKTTLLEQDVKDSGSSKRFKLDHSSLRPHPSVIQQLHGNLSQTFRCSVCGINTYSKEVHDNHMDLHRKRRQLIKDQGIPVNKFYSKKPF